MTAYDCVKCCHRALFLPSKFFMKVFDLNASWLSKELDLILLIREVVMKPLLEEPFCHDPFTSDDSD